MENLGDDDVYNTIVHARKYEIKMTLNRKCLKGPPRSVEHRRPKLSV